MQMSPLFGTFDWRDMLGTFIGGFLALIILWGITIKKAWD